MTWTALGGRALLRPSPHSPKLSPQALEHCGGVDFLVCCAGVNPLVGSTLGTSEQIWDKVRGLPPGGG